jgi:hypothetical protein
VSNVVSRVIRCQKLVTPHDEIRIKNPMLSAHRVVGHQAVARE